jgi:hypothetical protein
VIVFSVYKKNTTQKTVAFEGPCRVEAPDDEFFGGSKSKPYVGKVIESPTWKTLLSEAKKVQRATKDLHHIFLEDAVVKDVVDGVKVIELHFGS